MNTIVGAMVDVIPIGWDIIDQLLELVLLIQHGGRNRVLHGGGGGGQLPRCQRSGDRLGLCEHFRLHTVRNHTEQQKHID